ncbi:50S ribosomal protein L29 [Candidatus Woesearchaeota archaeon]|nr:50S ribosomal protein L29 [Candidatus Woesearchaeota archaeon]
MSSSDLHARLGEFKKELLKLNVQVATGANPASPGKLKQTKKNIARVLTDLQRREEA